MSLTCSLELVGALKLKTVLGVGVYVTNWQCFFESSGKQLHSACVTGSEIWIAVMCLLLTIPRYEQPTFHRDAPFGVLRDLALDRDCASIR
jgi:hypothetical protein